ncbi:MAG: hypothetical protein WBG48_09660 [Pricia sp.]
MQMQWLRATYLLLLLLVLTTCKETPPSKVTISSSIEHPQIEFVYKELKTALSEKDLIFELSQGKDADIQLFLITSKELRPEGFEISKSDQGIVLEAVDTAGLLYGGLELAEQIALYGMDGIKSVQHNPYMEMRGPKFNIPLDVRTPSYSDASDAGQQNIPVMWDYSFWTDFIDNLARHRYNYISLWSLHPFPSLVKVPGYENITLDDVQRSTGEWQELYNLNGIGLDTPEILKNPETVKKMTIDEKIVFWKKVMAYGKDRNIDFHWITWNVFDYGTGGQYGITDDLDSETTKDYFRKSVKQMFVTYPDLAGIGLTTGENMFVDGKRTGPEQREAWAYDTYALGILDAAREMPDRQFTFIHRQHQTGAKEIAEKFKSVIDAENIEFLYCFKYAKAHVYSSTEQPYHEQDNFVKDIQGMKTIWGLRNDDTYYYRWGAPDFVREFIENIPHEVAKGIYFGSDQWIWGRDFLTKNPETTDQLEIEKHWYQWMLWGRMSYDAQLPNDRITGILGRRFPEVDAQLLRSAWQQASMVYSVTTGFHWGRLDFQWYIEGCISHPRFAENESGFHDVDRFISLGVHPKSGNQSIPDYVSMKMNEESSELTSPIEVSTKLHELADQTLADLKALDAGDNKELQATLNDIETVAYLGKYYAHKIAGSTQVAMYRATKDTLYQKKAITELTKALEFWKKYTEQTSEQNKNPLWTNRVGHVDWEEITVEVAKDIEIARQKV